ncbi:glucokinase [Rivibacter subsaxonicus]|uniref:Glucokinase n=1 Tax=Rivibacter subsaxonicus TaxID=457575 RepID=A0A4V2FUH0_9BURK|nr:glucokinase [Rivibacter subsaxonicus]RZU01996.1 glucokinase [Rivibacter subsaxonicus]
MRGDASAAHDSFPRLVADIGGTNARFGWLADAASTVQHVRRLPVLAHAGPAPAVNAYLGELELLLGTAYRPPRRAAFAVASSVAGDQVDLTNSHWSFSRAGVEAELDLDMLLVLNDFEALALSLPRLGASQLRSHDQRPLPAPGGTLAVIGPGTGLGVGGVVQTRHGWVALSGEGGHATLSAADDFESELLARVRREYPHVSAERLLSGIGLPVLHAAATATTGATAAALTAEEIVERAATGSDPDCARTLDLFCALLGSFAGNVALTLGARGGVYIGGGIVPRLGERFFASRFRERFEAKGRFRSYLEGIPTVLIVDTEAALTGAALAIEQSAD